MKITDLINNKEFDFNVHYQIFHYDFGTDKETLMFDSAWDSDIPWDVALQDITAVNQADDGTVEIEYA